MNAEASLDIRHATVADVPVILQFVRELAEYERMLDQVAATEEDFRRALFGERPVAEALLAWDGDEPLGFALFFHNFSTFRGRPGLYLEDLYVRPAARNRGVGKALLAALARLAVERNCARLEWSVLDWNQPAIEFYQRIGAVPMSDWTVYRLTGEALERLAR